jgi:hypothetical protein
VLKIRIVTWNVNWRTGRVAEEQGRFLVSLRADIVLLQEANASSLDTFVTTAGLEWAHCSLDLREPLPGDGVARKRGCVIAGRGLPPASVRLLTDVPLPDRLLIGKIPLEQGHPLTVASYHAPPGVTWKKKNRNRQQRSPNGSPSSTTQ